MLKLPFLQDRELYSSFHRILGFYPRDIRPYKQALMHKSMAVKTDGRRQNNERLEFLGDAILDAVVGDIVYRHFKSKPEGFLTNTRSKIVQRETLNKIAVEIGLDKLIKSNGRAQNSHNSYLCGNAFEALVGAVYLDRGYSHCMRFMERQILKHLIDIDKVAYKEVNFKSKLLEWGQKNRIKLDFQLVREEKEGDSTPVFVSRVLIEGIDCGQGKGYSKKESQQFAAKDALYRLRKKKALEEQVFLAKGKRTAMEEQPQVLLPELPVDEALGTKSSTQKSEAKTQENTANTQTKVQEKASGTRSRGKKRIKQGTSPTKEDTAQNDVQEVLASSAAPVSNADTDTVVTAADEKPTSKPKSRRSPRKKADKTSSVESAETSKSQDKTAAQEKKEAEPRKSRSSRRGRKQEEPKKMDESGLEIDFSDVQMREKTRDEIIAEAEAKAFAEQ